MNNPFLVTSPAVVLPLSIKKRVATIIDHCRGGRREKGRYTSLEKKRTTYKTSELGNQYDFVHSLTGNLETGEKEGKILGCHKASKGSKGHSGHVLSLTVTTDNKFLVSIKIKL